MGTITETTTAPAEVTEIEAEVTEKVATTTLADLIRLGSEGVEQARYAWGNDEAACALGTAVLRAIKLDIIKA